MGEDSLLERVTTAAEERHLSQNTLTAYRRTWLKLIAWAAAEGLALETLPSDRAGEFYEEATRDRSASHHLQLKRPSRCSMTSWMLQIHSPSARLPNSRPRKPSCVTTLPRNWDNSCVSCVRNLPD
jgi:site-specific recombinase XerC